MTKPIIWTAERYLKMYTILRYAFGPLKTKDDAAAMQTSKRFKELCSDFAVEFGAASGAAVAQQIAWATTGQPKAGDRSHAQVYIVNKGIAYAAGLIRGDLMPQSLAISI